MGHEELAIAIAALIVWEVCDGGSGSRPGILAPKPRAAGDHLPSTSRRSLLMVLDNDILVELVL